MTFRLLTVVIFGIVLPLTMFGKTLEVRMCKLYSDYNLNKEISAELLEYHGHKAVKISFHKESGLFAAQVDLSEYALVYVKYDESTSLQYVNLPVSLMRSEKLGGVFRYDYHGKYYKDLDEERPKNNEAIRGFNFYGHDKIELLFIIPDDLWESGTLYGFRSGDKDLNSKSGLFSDSYLYCLWQDPQPIELTAPYSLEKIISALKKVRINNFIYMKLIELREAILAFQKANQAFQGW